MFSREPAKLKTQVVTIFEIYHTVILNSKILKIAFLLVDLVLIVYRRKFSKKNLHCKNDHGAEEKSLNKMPKIKGKTLSNPSIEETSKNITSSMYHEPETQSQDSISHTKCGQL